MQLIKSACLLAVMSSAFAQSVTLSNLSHPYTRIEVGNIVQISITGAAASGTVTVLFDGMGPTFVGYTDGSGISP